jgi:hypothetical protein
MIVYSFSGRAAKAARPEPEQEAREAKKTMKIKKLIFQTSAVAALLWLAAAAPVMANAAAPIRVTVPFAFEAGEHAMPAGRYEVEHRPASAMLVLTAPTGERHILLTFMTGDPANPKSPRLVFEKIGGTYRLAEVWVSGAATGAGVPPTKAQMLVAKNAKKERVEIALAAK